MDGQRGGGEDNGSDRVPEPHAVDLLEGLDILLCGAVVIDGEGVRVVVVRGQDLEVPVPDGFRAGAPREGVGVRGVAEGFFSMESGIKYINALEKVVRMFECCDSLKM